MTTAATKPTRDVPAYVWRHLAMVAAWADYDAEDPFIVYFVGAYFHRALMPMGWAGMES